MYFHLPSQICHWTGVNVPRYGSSLEDLEKDEQALDKSLDCIPVSPSSGLPALASKNLEVLDLFCAFCRCFHCWPSAIIRLSCCEHTGIRGVQNHTLTGDSQDASHTTVAMHWATLSCLGDGSSEPFHIESCCAWRHKGSCVRISMLCFIKKIKHLQYPLWS